MIADSDDDDADNGVDHVDHHDDNVCVTIYVVDRYPCDLWIKDAYPLK